MNMRTTITIDDELLRQLKEQAARTGRTIGALVEDAVRSSMARADERPDTIEPLPTFGGSGVMPGVDITDMRSLRDLMDDDVAIDALR